MSSNDPMEKTGTNDGDVEETMARFSASLARMADPAEGARIRALADDTGLEVLALAISEGARIWEGREAESLSARQAGPGLTAAERDAAAVRSAAERADELTVREVEALAIRAHRGQALDSGELWSEHLRVVAEAMTPFGPHLKMAGWLHDILEESEWTRWTAEGLRAVGVPDRVVEIVERVTYDSHREDYLDRIRLITQDPEATLVKIADNADSIRPEQGALSPAMQQLLDGWEQARRILWLAMADENITAIVSRINPRLLERRVAD